MPEKRVAGKSTHTLTHTCTSKWSFFLHLNRREQERINISFVALYLSINSFLFSKCSFLLPLYYSSLIRSTLKWLISQRTNTICFNVEKRQRMRNLQIQIQIGIWTPGTGSNTHVIAKSNAKAKRWFASSSFLSFPSHTRESEFVALTHTDARTAFAVGFSAYVCGYRYLLVALLVLSFEFSTFINFIRC